MIGVLRSYPLLPPSVVVITAKGEYLILRKANLVTTQDAKFIPFFIGFFFGKLLDKK